MYALVFRCRLKVDCKLHQRRGIWRLFALRRPLDADRWFALREIESMHILIFESGHPIPAPVWILPRNEFATYRAHGLTHIKAIGRDTSILNLESDNGN